MFLLTVFVYPLVLALLCAGTGLLLDRAAGEVLPGQLIALAGMAALIGISQLSTWIVPLAPATPYVVAALGIGGCAVGWRRVKALAQACGQRAQARAQLALTALVYLLAIAPVLLSGRPSFSSYMTLTDSAVHMIGADYLIGHGSAFAHLDLRNSYGQLVAAYYDSGYPSGADTVFGASAVLLRLPMIWAFQPFNAFALAMAVGPAWLLLRRIGLSGWWLGLSTLTVSVPALVYAYELIASVKEIVALPMLLGVGALVVLHERWLTRGPRGGIPIAVLVAAGVSALGVGFVAWVLVPAIVLATVALGHIRDGRWSARAALVLLGWTALALLLFALPTWSHASGSLEVSNTIATTSNSGNLQTPLRPVQMLGTWLAGSYMATPHGAGTILTDALVAITALAALLGAIDILSRRQWALASWLAGSLGVWAVLSAYGTTWVNAKGLVLTSSTAMLLAWAGVAALRGWRWPQKTWNLRPAAVAFAAAILAGVLLSDALQYHASVLAPTARYEEMASLEARFAGRGPTLFTDFDEYAMYELRSMDIGGPDFLYPPAALLSTTEGHGHSVNLLRAKPGALTRYPLIVTRRSPLPYRPPAAYQLLWHGTYYELWGRRHDAPASIVAVGLHGGRPASCKFMAKLAHVAGRRHAALVADKHPEIIQLGLHKLDHTHDWHLSGVELVMDGRGSLWSDFRVPRAGVYQLWMQGEAMPTLSVRVDGRLLGEVSEQVSGNGDSPDPMVPLSVRLSAGVHRLSVTRPGFSLAPGSGSDAYLEAVFLTPAGPAGQQHLETLPAARWRSLCGAHIDWIEVVPQGRPKAPRARLVDLRARPRERRGRLVGRRARLVDRRARPRKRRGRLA